jgi:tetratricopeptide (TPR) repeat protein
MAILRISQQPGSGPNKHQIAVYAEIPGFQPPSFSREIEFALSPQDGEKVRWYLEDYLQFDEDPAPKIAARVETLMAERGEALFRAIFEGRNDAILLWGSLEPHLSSTRIEIVTGIAEAMAIPWELIRNPHTRVNLALSAHAFVRSQPGGQTSLAPAPTAGKVRILLVICRPRAENDVPFRSVAGRLVKGLSDSDREAFQLHVLRPPTYEQLAKVLRLAKGEGEPYHIVHFDGHGVYADLEMLEGAGQSFSKVMLKGESKGPRGFLSFEDPDSKSRSQLVDGFKIGGLLRDAGVPILILNACQSAFAEAKSEPDENAPALEEIEAYGSLAQAVMNAGAAGVVAMRYSVYVVTAAQFVAELYGALARGRTLGEAVAWARGNLADEPERKIAYDPRPLQDWAVPLVWERTPLRLWPQKPEGAPLRIKLDGGGATAGALDPKLPAQPEVGFFGRDETLYALDRAFDRQKIVLLHAFAGSGKTTTAAEFARWYALTGGVQGPVLFTSLERHLPLVRVLDKIGEIFDQALEGTGVHWGAANDAQRRQIALDLLRQIPVLWIWDSVEPITGFPAGTPSEWSAVEQQDLRDFLLAARDTKAKFLLTSRRDEQAWLGEMPLRVQVPRMPMQERLQLAGAIAEHRRKRLADLPDLTPLLRFTEGNPLTILVTVGEALRAGIDSEERLDAFAAGLHAGEASFEDDATEGRTKSLGASLSYGFASAFNDEERKRLALLHIFQGFVDVYALRAMGSPQAEWALDEVRGLTREQGVDLLDRAAEIGLLISHGGGHYGVHPALPWYFRELFDRHFTGERAKRARRAFAEALGELGDLYHNQYGAGNRQVLNALMAEEDNMLAAWQLSRHYGWWDRVISAMQGLDTLYGETGRGLAWRRLVDAVTPDFIDPRTHLPLPGREGQWSLFSGYRVRLAEQLHDLDAPGRLQRLIIEWDRESALTALATSPEQRSGHERNAIRNLAAAVHELGEIQRENNDPSCRDTYREAFDLAQTADDRAAQAVCAYNLGIAYTDVAALRDFETAERWLRQSLELRLPTDAIGRGNSLSHLGMLALRRFDDALKNERAEEECLRFINDAAHHYLQSLQLFPPTAISQRGIIHNQLGVIFRRAGDIDRALQHYQQDIRYSEQAGDIFGAGQTRFNVALALTQAARLNDARAYAEAALANFRTFSGRAAEKIQRLSNCSSPSTKPRQNSGDNHERRLAKPPRPRCAAALGRRREAAGNRRRPDRGCAGARRAAAGENGRGRLVAVQRQGVAAHRACDRLSAGGRERNARHHRRRRGAG